MLLGSALVVLHLRASEGGRPPSWALALTHGLVGASGLGLLLWALAAGSRAVGAFGWDAVALLASTLALGAAIPLLARARRGTGAAMALHGSIAIIGYVILMAYVSVG